VQPLDAAGWLAVAATLLLGAAGARGTADGVKLNQPGMAEVAVTVAALAPTFLLSRGRAGRIGLGALPLLGAGLLALRGGPFAYLSGGPLFALGCGVLLAMAVGTRLRFEARLFLPVVLLVHLLASVRVQAVVGPEGDEPHYLMVADSLLRDRDLAVERDFQEGRYRAFHPAPLEPHYRVRGADGRIYSLHAVGLSLLILPAYALGGYPAASLFMALLSTALAWQVRRLVEEATGEPDVGAAVGWLVAFTPPVLSYAGLVFTEIPAALIVAFALRCVALPQVATGSKALTAAAGLAFLPWLNVRYAPLAAILLAVAALRVRHPRGLATWLAPATVSAVAIAAWHRHVYGFFDPRRVYGQKREMDPSSIPGHLPGIFLDQEFGLLVYAPILLLGLVGLVKVAPRWARLAGIALVLAVVLVTASWPMWRGGFNPPARFLVPLVAPLALGLAAVLRAGFGPAAALLAGWSLCVGLAGVADPALVHRDRDGGAPIFRVHSGAAEWTRLLPGWVLSEDAPAAPRMTMVWALALVVAAVPLLHRRREPGTMAAATAAAVAFTVIAATLASGAAGSRDAVRGRWTETSWDPPFGPVYEPHRHPAGAIVGDRLPLAAGRYRLRLVGERLGPAPALAIRAEPSQAVRRQTLDASFDVDASMRFVTLLLEGGGPQQVSRVTLVREAQP
jgi:MYXO-CTERM domain-containing protein